MGLSFDQISSIHWNSIWVKQPGIQQLWSSSIRKANRKQAGNLDFMAFAALYIVETPFMSGEHLSKVTSTSPSSFDLISFRVSIILFYFILFYFILFYNILYLIYFQQPALEYEKRQAFWREGNFGVFPFMEAIAQPIWDLQGVQRDFLQGKRCGRVGKHRVRKGEKMSTPRANLYFVNERSKVRGLNVPKRCIFECWIQLCKAGLFFLPAKWHGKMAAVCWCISLCCSSGADGLI